MVNQLQDELSAAKEMLSKAVSKDKVLEKQLMEEVKEKEEFEKADTRVKKLEQILIDKTAQTETEEIDKALVNIDGLEKAETQRDKLKCDLNITRELLAEYERRSAEMQQQLTVKEVTTCELQAELAQREAVLKQTREGQPLMSRKLPPDKTFLLI